LLHQLGKNVVLKHGLHSWVIEANPPPAAPPAMLIAKILTLGRQIRPTKILVATGVAAVSVIDIG